VRRRREAEQLRDRIARDLHDEVGSNLGSILLLGQLAQGKEAIAAQKDLAEVGRIAAQTADSMRDLVWVLGRGTDTGADLLARLREATASLLVGIDYSIDADETSLPKRLSPEFKRQMLFGFKEALHNVVRHSGAKRVFIRCWLSEASFWVEVRDDGRGFDPDHVAGGTGLRGLRLRAKSLGGELELESRPGQGTVVRLRLPAR
jgi:signal transduction histidine kinase